MRKSKDKWSASNPSYVGGVLFLVEKILQEQPVIRYPITKDEKKRQIITLVFKP